MPLLSQPERRPRRSIGSAMMQAGTDSMAEDALTQALKKRRQISITVIGGRTGHGEDAYFAKAP